VVNKCVELGLLDVVFTLDGKEYLTHEKLSTEILDELCLHAGTEKHQPSAPPNTTQHFIHSSHQCPKNF
jgi:hypothetical protein